uniref:Uncharacterized protein n=1 Tax=Oryza meridionalis TaxID=40149 RepID=A0A0E0ERQ5_9ORYZ
MEGGIEGEGMTRPATTARTSTDGGRRAGSHRTATTAAERENALASWHPLLMDGHICVRR